MSVPPDCPTPSSSLTSSGQSATPSSQTFAWVMRVTRRYPCPPNRVQAGRSQDVPEEGSLFHVSPVSPGFLTRPSRDAPQFPLDGVLLPSTMDDFSDSELGAPITYAQCELIPGSDTPMSLPVFSVPSGFSARPDQSSIQTVLALGTSSHPDGGSSAIAPPMDMEDGPLLETGLTASSPPVPGVRQCAAVGSPLIPLPNVIGVSTRKGTNDGRCRQPATRCGHYVVQFSDTVAVCHVVDPYVVRNYGLHDEVAGLSPARVAKYMPAMGLWHPQTGQANPGPVPASTCRSCMNCDYCFPEDRLPPE